MLDDPIAGLGVGSGLVFFLGTVSTWAAGWAKSSGCFDLVANTGHFSLVSQEVLCPQTWVPGLLASEAQQQAPREGEELPQG